MFTVALPQSFLLPFSHFLVFIVSLSFTNIQATIPRADGTCSYQKKALIHENTQLNLLAQREDLDGKPDKQ